MAKGAQPPLGYGRQWIDDDDVAAVVEVLRGDRLTQGPFVRRFEQSLERATGAPRAVALASGTAGLALALRALEIGPGSRVVTSANTFLASATAALHCGAEVDFVDVLRETRSLDSDLLDEACTRGRVDAVVAVDFAGRPCDVARLLELKARHGFRLVVDACHSLGATFEAGGRTWRVGEHPGIDATVLSFHPVKLITTGEGGAVLAGDPALASRVERLRDHGIDRGTVRAPFDDGPPAPWFAPMEELGFNARLPDLLAALGASQMRRLEAFLARRRELAARYVERLTGVGCPALEAGHAWHLFAVDVDPGRGGGRDGLMAHLAAQGIGTQVHYYPVPRQPYFRARFEGRAFPEAERHARRSLSLPLYPALREEEQERVLAAVAEWEAR